MKLLMESWRKFLNERMEFGEGFERWLHGEIPDVFPGGQPRYDDRMDVDEPEFGQGGDCKPQSIDPECLEDYGFEKIGEGSFRAVWALPDNPNYVMKIADELWDDADTKDMNSKRQIKSLRQVILIYCQKFMILLMTIAGLLWKELRLMGTIVTDILSISSLIL